MSDDSESEGETERKTGMILRTNGKVEGFTYTGYESLREGVGGNIEVALTGPDPRSGTTSEGWDLWCHGEGRLIPLPLNQVARVFVATMSNCPISEILSLHGDMVLLGHDGQGETISCSETIAAIATGCAMYDEPQTRFTTFDEDGNILTDTDHERRRNGHERCNG